MLLARVIGAAVATKKEPTLHGLKLLLVRPLALDGHGQLEPGPNTVVVADTHGAGVGELVLICQGSSARQAHGLKAMPVDAAVVGIVDSVDVSGKRLQG